MPFNPETGTAAGEASGRARRRKALAPEDRALEAIANRLPALADELLDAAFGKGAFEALKPETRLQAVVRALEWRLGKPSSRLKEVDTNEQPLPTPDELFRTSDTQG